MTKRIFAIGGGLPNDPIASKALLRTFLQLSGQNSPRVLWVNTALGDNEVHTNWFYRSLADAGARVRELHFFGSEHEVPRDLKSLVLSFDAIYVGGGNTASALAVWRSPDYQFDKALQVAYEQGVLLGGAALVRSAGSSKGSAMPGKAGTTL